ncbi:hypothetical protein rsdtw13_34810 [Clostridium sp. TW13]|uniref:Uncharacterized protein n=1 Tax=Inconstantimicrobium mannanitabidum TaxID=1604901 RepID=A0ACB5RGL3_9CLOT|nr:hypothetical protein rsdtw13_34810 [Clostridium sp. TW13]
MKQYKVNINIRNNLVVQFSILVIIGELSESLKSKGNNNINIVIITAYIAYTKPRKILSRIFRTFIIISFQIEVFCN